jgi:hypothetical protein
MQEQKKILTDTRSKQTGGVTTLIVVDGLNEQTYTLNEPTFTELPRTMIGENIMIDDGVLNSVPYREGDLLMTVRDQINKINYHLSEKGDLFVNCEDANRYSINADGDLIYDYSIPIKKV